MLGRQDSGKVSPWKNLPGGSQILKVILQQVKMLHLSINVDMSSDQIQPPHLETRAQLRLLETPLERQHAEQLKIKARYKKVAILQKCLKMLSVALADLGA